MPAEPLPSSPHPVWLPPGYSFDGVGPGRDSPVSSLPTAMPALERSSKTFGPAAGLGLAGLPSLPDRRSYHGSTAWTSLGSEADDPFTSRATPLSLPEQGLFLQEYNYLANKHGLSLLVFDDDPSDQRSTADQGVQTAERPNWFARTFGKPPSSASRPSSRHSERGGRHRRSDSDPSQKDAKDTLKNETLQTLVRICGKSQLYLPAEYATRALVLPTCLRAAAQYLAQNGPDTRGVFRISGAMRVVNALYDYYCVTTDDGAIAATVRSPNLPFHIKAGAHDVASMFKRLLSGLPGGILGYLSLFDALVSIHRLSHGDIPGLDGKEHKILRARLIALAVASMPSLLQRELVCAVFGLLSLIGHAAEEDVRHEDAGQPKPPSSEKMGYAALGIIFGPLLVGDLLNSFSPNHGDATCSTPSPKPKIEKHEKHEKLEKHKKNVPSSATPLSLDSVLLANDVAEMLIMHWRDVVHQMKSMGVMPKQPSLSRQQSHRMQQLPRQLRPSRSETFTDLEPNDPTPSTSPVRQPHLLRKMRSESMSMSPTSSVRYQHPPIASAQHFEATKTIPRKKASSTFSIASGQNDASAKSPAKALSPTEEEELFFGSGASDVGQAAQQQNQQASLDGLQDPFVSAGPHQEPSTPWNVRLKKVTTRDEDTKPSAEATPRRSQDQAATDTCPTTPDMSAKVPKTPQSKTAALIARIMNTKQETTPAHLKKGGGKTDASGRKENGLSVPRESPRSSFEHAQSARPSLDRPRSEFSENRKKWMRRSIAEASVTDQPDPPAPVTPTPKRRWRARSSPPDSRDQPTSGGKTATESARKRHNLIKRRPVAGKASEEHASPARELDGDRGNGNRQSPLSEIKNNARGVHRSRSKTVRPTHKSPWIDTAATEADRHDSNPASAGAVKAMAALFDSAATRDSAPGTPTQNAPLSARSRDAKKATELLSQYTRNASPPKAEVEIAYSTPHGDRGEFAPRSAREVAGDRRRLRLSRSEDRRGHHGSAGSAGSAWMAVGDRRARAAGQAVDWKDLDAIVGHKPQATASNHRTGEHLGHRGAQSTPANHVAASVRKFDLVPSHLRRDDSLDSARSARDVGVHDVSALQTQIEDLRREFETKAIECQSWKERAEAAEERAAELELSLKNAESRHSSIYGENYGTPKKRVLDGRLCSKSPRVSAAVHAVEGTPPRGLENRWLGSSSGAAASATGTTDDRKHGGRGSPVRRRAADLDDGSLSDKSSMTVLVHGRIGGSRSPFAA